MQAFCFDEVDSTNDAAGRLLRAGRIGERAYVFARFQTAGRGTRGRSWVSPRDAGLYLSVIDRPSHDGGEVRAFTRATGVACAETLLEETGVEVRLKPINDLYVDERKLGGILTEAIIEGGRMRALITGVGVNVRRAPREIEAQQALPICLEELMAPYSFAELNLGALAAALARRVCSWNAFVARGDMASLEEAWRRFALPGGDVVGQKTLGLGDRIEA